MRRLALTTALQTVFTIRALGHTNLSKRQFYTTRLFDFPPPLLYANMTGNPVFDVLTTDSAELQALLATGKVTSVDIVEASLDQIDKHNAKGLKLNAIISTTPRELALSIAKDLDVERSQGKIRGPLHGIPITIKDNIMTGPEFRMPTTVGSAALRSAMAKRNAPVVDLVGLSVAQPLAVMLTVQVGESGRHHHCKGKSFGKSATVSKDQDIQD